MVLLVAGGGVFHVPVGGAEESITAVLPKDPSSQKNNRESGSRGKNNVVGSSAAVGSSVPATDEISDDDGNRKQMYSLVGKLDAFARLANLLNLEDAFPIIERARVLQGVVLESKDSIAFKRDLELFNSDIRLLEKMLRT